jgi:NIPSNAP protein
MIYELRIYSCIPGRLPVLLKRFEEHTLKLFEKHGIKQAGFWTVLVGEGNNDLHYLLAWETLAQREKVWTAFQGDPAWIKARDDSERDGLIIANIKSLFPAADGVLGGQVTRS